MMSRVQVALPPEEHRRARARAAELGISFAEYVRGLIARDLGAMPAPRGVADLFDLGETVGSDVALEQERYLREAFEARA
jgi:hypothetical protein